MPLSISFKQGDAMRHTFNEAANKIGRFVRQLFAEKIDGHRLDLGVGPAFSGTLRYAVRENPGGNDWKVKAILSASSRLSARVHFTRTLDIASFPEKQQALGFMALAEPGLKRHAPLLLSRMGISDPAACFPVIAPQTAKKRPTPAP